MKKSMDPYYIGLARSTMAGAIRKLEETHDYLVEARDCDGEVQRVVKLIHGLQREQDGLRELLQVAADDSRWRGLELPDEVIALRRALDEALAEEPTA